MWRAKTIFSRISTIRYTRRRNLCILSCIGLLILSVRALALQDEMAVGRFMPGSAKKTQIVRFHFEHGKTFVQFFEELPDSPYLFPIYQIVLTGQITERPIFDDINNDSFDDIIYTTTAGQGLIQYNAAEQKLIVIKDVLKKREEATIGEELQQFDDLTR